MLCTMVDIKSAGGYLISKLFSGSSVFVLLPCGAQVQQLSAQIQILQQKVKVKNCQESVKKLLIQIKNIFYLGKHFRLLNRCTI